MDRLNIDCRHRAGFMCRLSRLNPTASEKMGASSRTMKTFFFSSPILSVENKTFEDVYAFFLLFTIPIILAKIGHLRT